jgi:hypothetical protein
MEAPKRLQPTGEVLRRLFAFSGNLCAFDGCAHVMVNPQGIFVGQICHVEAAEPGGQRFRADMTNEQRRSFENLLLLCYGHHVETNDESQYPVERLRQIKHSHEARFANPETALARSFEDTAAAHPLVPHKTLRRFASAMNWEMDSDELRATAQGLDRFTENLRMVPRAERQLLSILAQRQKHGNVYLSELTAITNRSAMEILDAMDLLQKYRLVRVSEDMDHEGNPMYESRDMDGWDIASDLATFCNRENIQLEALIVDLHFDLLD